MHARSFSIDCDHLIINSAGFEAYCDIYWLNEVIENNYEIIEIVRKE